MKKTLASVSQLVGHRYVLFGARLALGATFILAATAKLPQQAKFVELVTGLGLLPWELAETYGSILPRLELAVGICLVAGLLCRVAAGTSILMVISFLVANGTGVYKYIGCPCFGDLIILKTSDALLIDVAMMAVSLLVLLYGGGFLSFDYLISTTRLGRLAWFSSGLTKGLK